MDGTSYSAQNIVLATGSTAKTFGLPLSDKVITSTEALEMEELPSQRSFWAAE